MQEPRAERPHMPGYGISEDPDGLLPWSWAEERLVRAHDYWLATARPDSRPHLMPVWAVWRAGALWFSSGRRSRKARNLAADPRCSLATDDPYRPVVVEGRAELVRDTDLIARFCGDSNAKYETDYGVDFYDPDTNGVYRVVAERVIALDEAAFPTSPTRWTFT